MIIQDLLLLGLTVLVGAVLATLFASHAARVYLLLEQVSQLRYQMEDCLRNMRHQQEQHRKMVAALNLPETGLDETAGDQSMEESVAERLRDHPAPPRAGS